MPAMRWLLVPLIVLTTLSGCTTTGTSLNTYLMHPSEAPDGCGLVDMDSDVGHELTAATGMQANPGAMNGSFFEQDGIAPLDNRVVVYACDGDDVTLISAVERFASEADATQWFEGRIRCDESPTFRDGVRIGAIEPTDGPRWDQAHLAAAYAAVDRIIAQTDAEYACPPLRP